MKKVKIILSLVICLFTTTSSTLAYTNYNKLVKEMNYERTTNITIAERKTYTTQLTMYNAGDPYQTDMSPCISASGDNICQLIAQNTNVCASNFLPLGITIRIKDIGDCIILDRMSNKYNNRIDWALPADKKKEAVKFGIKTIEYQIVN